MLRPPSHGKNGMGSVDSYGVALILVDLQVIFERIDEIAQLAYSGPLATARYWPNAFVPGGDVTGDHPISPRRNPGWLPDPSPLAPGRPKHLGDEVVKTQTPRLSTGERPPGILAEHRPVPDTQR